MKNKKTTSKSLGLMPSGLFLLVFSLHMFFIHEGFSAETLPGCYLYKTPKEIRYFKAQNKKSFFICLGYLHGSQHPYSLDLMRRRAYGRLSVLKGQATYESDFLMRMLNLEKLSKRLWENLSPDIQDYFEFYTLGINTGLKEAIQRRLPVYKTAPAPKKWHPRHSLALLLLYHFEVTKKQLPSLLSKIPGGTNNFIRSLFQAGPFIENHFADPTLIGFKAPLSFQFPLFKDFFGAQFKESPLMGASIPGIPIFFQGFNQFFSWSLLPKSSLELQSIDLVPEDELTIHQIYPLIKIKKGPVLVESQNKSYQVTTEGHPILPLKKSKGEKALLKWRGLKLKAHHIEKLFELQWILGGVSTKGTIDMNVIKEIGEKSIHTSFANNFFDFIISSADSNDKSPITSSNHFRENPKKDFIISNSLYIEKTLASFKTTTRKWNFKYLRAFQCSDFPFPFQKNELVKKKELFLKKVKVSRISFSQKKAYTLIKKWGGNWREDCRPCTFFYVWFFNTKNGSAGTVQRGFEEAVSTFREKLKLNVPTWDSFKRANSFFLKKRSFQSLLMVRDQNQSKVFLTSKGQQENSCSLKEAPLFIKWEEEDLRYRRFKNL
ncbi:MAG: penicillin acylase family protein [Bdellovibrionota bacterium]|nr:penicillin acylase family protein [Bdellovibrionota bacterium]